MAISESTWTGSGKGVNVERYIIYGLAEVGNNCMWVDGSSDHCCGCVGYGNPARAAR